MFVLCNQRPGRGLNRVISLFMVLVLVVSCAGEALAADGVSSREFDPQNWQSRMEDTAHIREIVLPSSHDSGTYDIHFTRVDELCQELLNTLRDKIKENVLAVVGGAIAFIMDEFLAVLAPIISKLAKNIITDIQQMCGKCQSKPISEQLKAGVRAFDFRYRYDGGEFHIYHGDETEGLAGIIQTCVCYNGSNSQLKLSECFWEIRTFLDEHPTEFVLVYLQNEGGEYNDDVQRALDRLENAYGIIDHMPDDLTPVRYLRGNIYDITRYTEDISGRSWDATVAQKKEFLDSALLEDTFAVNLGEAQANIAVKMWRAHDPNGECSFPLRITGWTTIFGYEILPTGFEIDLEMMIKTPYAQSTQINPYLLSMLKGPERINPYVNLISTDFVTAEMSCAIVNLNARRHRMKDQSYTYSGYDLVMTDRERNDSSLVLNVDTDELANALLAEVESVHGSVMWTGGSAGSRPSSLTLRLYRQAGVGAAQEVDHLTVSPDSMGRWSFDFGLRQRRPDGQPVSYSVRCDVPDNYLATYDGYQITLAPQHPFPDTGDALDPRIPAVLMALSLAVLVLAVSRGRRKGRR